MAKNKGLGRGLASLISEDVMNLAQAEAPAKEKDNLVFELDINKIRPNPDQPRRQFEETSLRDLANSISQYGIIQPLTVHPEREGYTIVAGERRFRAAKLADLKRVPVIIKDLDPKAVLEIALIENVQREDLNPIEVAMAYERLMKNFSLTQEELSKRIGKSRSAIANILRLLKLPESVRQMVLENTISAGHAKALLGLEHPEEMEEAARIVADEQLSVRDTEKLCKEKIIKRKKVKVREIPLPEKSAYLLDCEAKLKEAYGTQCTINGNDEKGLIVMAYGSAEEYNRLYELLMKKGERS